MAIEGSPDPDGLCYNRFPRQTASSCKAVACNSVDRQIVMSKAKLSGPRNYENVPGKAKS
jgi:hypothetical protein